MLRVRPVMPLTHTAQQVRLSLRDTRLRIWVSRLSTPLRLSPEPARDLGRDAREGDEVARDAADEPVSVWGDGAGEQRVTFVGIRAVGGDGGDGDVGRVGGEVGA